MKKSFLYFLLLACIGSFTSFAKSVQPCVVLPKKQSSIPVAYDLLNSPTKFFIPDSCSGMPNDYIEGLGNLSVSVQGKIQSGQVSVRVTVDYTGMAKSLVSLINYSINGNINVSETRTITTDPVDIFVKGELKLISKHKTDNLYMGSLGYVTVYPDGSVINHILDPTTDPNYSMPVVYCSNPAGK